jgi:hypothetical protein
MSNHMAAEMVNAEFRSQEETVMTNRLMPPPGMEPVIPDHLTPDERGDGRIIAVILETRQEHAGCRFINRP